MECKVAYRLVVTSYKDWWWLPKYLLITESEMRKLYCRLTTVVQPVFTKDDCQLLVNSPITVQLLHSHCLPIAIVSCSEVSSPIGCLPLKWLFLFSHHSNFLFPFCLPIDTFTVNNYIISIFSSLIF